MGRALLSGLAGVDGDVEAAWVESADDAVAAIGHGELAVTAAGSNGAINIWKVGNSFHCERMRLMVTQSLEVLPNLTAVNEWAQREWPEIR